MIFKNSILFLSLLFLSACTSKGSQVEDFDTPVKDQFRTSIKGDGIKLFVYKVTITGSVSDTLSHQERAKQIKALKKSGSKSRSIYTPDLSEWTEQIELGLEKTIAMTGYCREGYMELSRMIEYGRGEIRGECNEGASAEDSLKF